MLSLRSGDEAMQLPGRELSIWRCFQFGVPALLQNEIHKQAVLKGNEGIALAPNLADFLGVRLLFK